MNCGACACSCTPLAQCPAGRECGTYPDGCGGVVTCPVVCANLTPICADNVCTACTSSTQCAGGEVCTAGSCQACDVCASGCAFTSVQAAADAASSGATVRIRAGTYGRTNGGLVASITRNLMLVGAWQGAAGTILDGGGEANTNPVVRITEGAAVELRDLRVTGANGSPTGSGGIGATGSGVTLNRVTLTGNTSRFGGIYNHSSGKILTITGCTLTQNNAVNGGGLYSERARAWRPGPRCRTTPQRTTAAG